MIRRFHILSCIYLTNYEESKVLLEWTEPLLLRTCANKADGPGFVDKKLCKLNIVRQLLNVWVSDGPLAANACLKFQK